ncbi:MAG TPA: PDZ domain-containing protein [Pyrinomonadaceae bacterium]|nr:PDZ domain-containing protein [Pyrinomonadaceae bacterium]
MRKVIAFGLIGLIGGSVAIAQTPAPMPRGETRVFSMFSGDGGYLGVQTAEVTKDNFTKFGLREVRGVAVEKVMEGSPAAAAGLQTGDVIVQFNGEEVTSVRKLTRLIGEVDPDHQARVTVIRGGNQRELTATLGKRPAPKFEEGAFGMTMPRIERFPVPPSGESPRVFSVPAPDAPNAPFIWRTGARRQIGVGITPLTKQLAEHFGVDGGIMINDVRKDSPADKAGLKAGDIIVEVEGSAVKGEGDVLKAIAEKKEGDISLTIVRDRNRQTVRVTPESIKGGFDSFYGFPDGDGPGEFRMTMPQAPAAPATLATPVPLNELFIPGRVI